MIVLNTAKELAKIEDWADIVSRPGFTTELDPQAHNLESIIGRYAFRDMIRCGLSNCHTSHTKGYIVTTKDGCETNIGKDCGRTYFGVDFETLSAKFDRDITEKENRDKLWSFSFGADELKSRVALIRQQTRGADWVYHHSRPLLDSSKEFSSTVVRLLKSMVKMRNPTLTVQREATEQEVENLEASQNQRLPRPHYLDERISEIDGFDALYPENDLRSLLVFEVEEKLKLFEKQDIDVMSYEELRRWAKWTGTIDATLEKANQMVTSGRRLLTPANLEPLSRILGPTEDVGPFRKYMRTLGEAWKH